MSKQDDITNWLLERGRDPLEAVFIAVSDDLFDAFPGEFKMRQSDYEKLRAERLEEERKKLDAELKDAIARMPKPMRDRLAELIQQRIQRALDEQRKVAA